MRVAAGMQGIVLSNRESGGGLKDPRLEGARPLLNGIVSGRKKLPAERNPTPRNLSIPNQASSAWTVPDVRWEQDPLFVAESF